MPGTNFRRRILMNGGVAFNPLSLFAGGEKGVIYDFTSSSSMFTTAAGSTPATVVGDVIGRVVDQSPNGLNATQTDTANSRLPTVGIRGGVRFAHGDGRTNGLKTAPMDLSGTSQITVVIGAVKVGDAMTGFLLSTGNQVYPAGTFAINSVYNLNSRDLAIQVRGSSSFDIYTTPAQSPASLALSVVLDITQASIANRIKARLNGVVPSLTQVVAGGQGTVFAADQALNILFDANSGYAKADLYRVVVISRALTASEIVKAEAWVSAPIPPLASQRAIILGDSTVTGAMEQQPVSHFTTRIAANVIASSGETIAQQQTHFEAMPSYAGYGVIIIQVGLNDLNPAEASSVAIARLQGLVDSVNARKAVGAKVIISSLTPAKASLVATYGAGAYQKWLDVNEAIAGSGATPITGVDARVTSHATALNDGAGNLAGAYDIGDHIHENNAGRAIIAAAWDVALVSVGL